MAAASQPSPAAAPLSAPSPTAPVADTTIPLQTDPALALPTATDVSPATDTASVVNALVSGSISGSGSAPLFGGSASQNNTNTRMSIPYTYPPGGIVMTNPPQTATSFYKVAPKQIVTFGWNFTYMVQDSNHLTVSAVCENGNTYPVGPSDGVIPGTATEVLWDLYSYQANNPQRPLALGTYTLSVWDERGKDAVAAPGVMRPYGGLKFGLYTPQPYVPMNEGWTCTDCHEPSGGVLSAASHPAFVGFVVSALVILLSGFHLLRPQL